MCYAACLATTEIFFLMCSVQRLCSSKLVRVDDHGNTVSMSPTDFSTPKQFLMGQWGRTIMSLGSANLTSTGYGERSHVALKESYRFTNRRDQDAINKQARLGGNVTVIHCAGRHCCRVHSVSCLFNMTHIK